MTWPLYVMQQRPAPLGPEYAGRVLTPVQDGAEALPLSPDQYLQAVGDEFQPGPQDVVWVPLYTGAVDHPSNWPPEKLSDYDRHVEFLRDLAPQVQGILTGNHGPELSYKHQGWHEQDNVRRMCSFVEATAPLIAEAGARPVYGTIDWDLLHDVYSGGKLGQVIRQYGGLQICFTGFTLIKDARMIPGVKHFAGAQREEVERLGEAGLREYLVQYEVWSGVCGVEGLPINAPLLAGLGFRAGMIRA